MSFMNLSGGPIKNITEKYKVDLDNVYVVHDDMDIVPGSIRVKRGGSSAGHNGLKSISTKLQSDDYTRIRIGIGHAPGQKPYVDYVLEEPKGKLLEAFDQSCRTASDAVIFLFTHTLEQAQQEYNHKNQ